MAKHSAHKGGQSGHMMPEMAKQMGMPKKMPMSTPEKDMGTMPPKTAAGGGKRFLGPPAKGGKRR